MCARRSALLGVKIRTLFRPREMLTYHCCAFVARADGRVAEEHVVHGLALRGVRGYGVAAGELPVACRKRSSVSEFDLSGGADVLDRDDFAVGQHFTASRLRVRF